MNWQKTVIWFLGCWLLWLGIAYLWSITGEPRAMLALGWVLMLGSVAPLVMRAIDWLST
jgi:hypothetical protein